MTWDNLLAHMRRSYCGVNVVEALKLMFGTIWWHELASTSTSIPNKRGFWRSRRRTENDFFSVVQDSQAPAIPTALAGHRHMSRTGKLQLYCSVCTLQRSTRFEQSVAPPPTKSAILHFNATHKQGTTSDKHQVCRVQQIAVHQCF